MPVTRTISTKLAIQGESEYQQSLKKINSSLGSLDSQLKLTKSEFQNHQNSLQALQAKEKALTDIQDTLKDKVQACKDAYANAQKAMVDYQQSAEKNRSTLKKVEEAIKGLDSESKKSGSQWAAYQNQIDAAEKKLEKLQKTSGDTSKEEVKLRKEIEQARAAMDKLESETDGAAKTAGELLYQQQKLTEEVDKAEAGYAACEKACNSWTKQQNNAQIALNNVTAELELNGKYLKEAETSANECATSIDEFGNRVEQAGSATTELYDVLVGAGLIQAIKEVEEAFAACVDAAAEFEAQMSTVEAISGATQGEMQELSTLAKEMGATTKFTATEAGEGLEYMAMAGWKAEDMLDGLAGIMNLAAAASEDLGTTSDIVTDALTAFGLAASDSAHFSDVLAQASANSNTNVSMLGESFKAVATTAGSLNYSIDDMAVALGAMANQGLKGEMAGTALATALTRMAGTNENAKKAMKELGLSMFDGQHKAKELSMFLDELRDAFSGMNQQQVVSYAYMLAGQRGMKGLQAIVNTSEADWNNLTEAIAGSSGAAKLMAETKLDNYAGQVILLKSAFDALKTEIGGVLTPVLGDLAETATSALGWMTDVVREHPGLVATFTALTVAIGTLTAGLAAMTVGSSLATKAWVAMTTAIKTNPIGLAITAIVALGAALVSLSAVISSYEEKQKDATNTAKALTEAFEEQRQEYEATKKETQEATDSIKSMANELADLASASDKSSSESERMAYLVGKLNTLVPDLALEFDKETGSINMTTDALREMTEAHAEQAEYEDAVARLNELLDERERLTNEIKLREEELNEAQVTQQELLANDPWATFRGSYRDAYSMILDTTEALALNREEQERVESEIAKLEEYVNSYTVAQEEAVGVSEQASITAKNLADQIIELRTAYDEAYDSALDSIQGQAEAWDTLDEVVAMSFEDITAALESQIAYWNDYTANIDNLTSRNIEGIDRLVSAYDGNAAAIAGLAAMSDEQISATISRLDKVGVAEDTAAQHTSEAVTGYSKAAQELIDNVKATLANPENAEAALQAALDMLAGFASGVDESGKEVDKSVQIAAQGAIDTMMEALDEHSPSRVFEDIGKNAMLGFTNGVEAEDSNTKTTLQSLAQKAIDAFNGIANGNSLVNSGLQTVSGYMSGVNSQSEAATSRMAVLAQNAVNMFKSNSMATSLQQAGSSTISGYVLGANSQSGAAVNTMRSLAQSAINAMRNNSTASSLYNAGVSTIQGYINGVAANAGNLYNTLANMALNALSRFKSALGIHSPSTEFASAGRFTMAGYIQGIKQQQASVQGTMAEMAKTASTSFRSGLNYDVDDVNAAVYGRERADVAHANTSEQSINIRIELPIYTNGQFTRREIIEIARAGISRELINLNAAKGIYT